jgi:uracil-DNA glycosylase
MPPNRNCSDQHVFVNWRETQKEIASCDECVGRWTGQVSAPLQIGEIPDPPTRIKILFVGVAPTDVEGKNKGHHFYSSPSDNLRNGLFRLLSHRFGVLLKNLTLLEGNQSFHKEGFFFVHAGKSRPVGQDAPPEIPLVYCSDRHLRIEIAVLNPIAICFLGVTNLAPASQSLFRRQIGSNPVRSRLDQWNGWVAVAPQPVRGHERRTELVINKLLKLIG